MIDWEDEDHELPTREQERARWIRMVLFVIGIMAMAIIGQAYLVDEQPKPPGAVAPALEADSTS